MRVPRNAVFGFALAALIFMPVTNTAIAQSVHIQPGKRGAGQDARLELDGQTELGLLDCKRTKYAFQFALSFLPPELGQEHELGEPRRLFVCLNEICEEREWSFDSTEFGEGFLTSFSISRRFKNIRSLRIMFSKEHHKYKFIGDVNRILQQICK
jgi:hypothetical protein